MVTTHRAGDRQPDDDPTGDPGLEELVGLLFRLTRDLRQRFAERSAALDLSFAQAMALRELDQPLPMWEMAERLCCDASNVTGIVDRLEGRGLVERRVASGDRRVKHLVLTDAGRALRQQHRDGLTDGLPLLDELSPGERKLLAGLLRRALGETDLAPGAEDQVSAPP